MSVRPARRTLVVTLADLGLSVRMQRHALALARARPDAEVDVIGGAGGPVQMSVAAEDRVHCRRLPPPPAAAHRSRWDVRAWGRSSARAAHLAGALFGGRRPADLLVQGPASGSARTLSWTAARWRGARLIIDWHDRTPAPDAGSERGGRSGAARAALRRERRWARHAHGHLAASRAMAEWLRREHRVDAAVLHDRPPSWVQRADLATAARLWAELARDLSLGPRRIPIATCLTGWTPCDDFDLLLESLERAERRLAAEASSAGAAGPDLAVLIVGRGPLRGVIEARLARRSFARIAVRTTWLNPADALTLTGMSDVGICLHQSASGLDLPGTLAEFRGVGVPVAAFDYAPVLGEVLETGKQGLTFRDPGGLARTLVALATQRLEEAPGLVASREWLAAHPAERWEEHWASVAAPLFADPS